MLILFVFTACVLKKAMAVKSLLATAIRPTGRGDQLQILLKFILQTDLLLLSWHARLSHAGRQNEYDHQNHRRGPTSCSRHLTADFWIALNEVGHFEWVVSVVLKCRRLCLLKHFWANSWIGAYIGVSAVMNRDTHLPCTLLLVTMTNKQIVHSSGVLVAAPACLGGLASPALSLLFAFTQAKTATFKRKTLKW